MNPITFLAIDPGTHSTGLAVFKGQDLVAYELVKALAIYPIELRIIYILQAMDDFVHRHPEIRQVACERPFLQDNAPAPELQAFVRRLKRWATNKREGHHFTWHLYYPSTVVASVRPRGLKLKGVQGWTSKDTIKLGVEMLYGVEDLDQNVLDAIAVGHCHLSKQREVESTERAG